MSLHSRTGRGEEVVLCVSVLVCMCVLICAMGVCSSPSSQMSLNVSRGIRCRGARASWVLTVPPPSNLATHQFCKIPALVAAQGTSRSTSFANQFFFPEPCSEFIPVFQLFSTVISTPSHLRHWHQQEFLGWGQWAAAEEGGWGGKEIQFVPFPSFCFP